MVCRGRDNLCVVAEGMGWTSNLFHFELLMSFVLLRASDDQPMPRHRAAIRERDINCAIFFRQPRLPESCGKDHTTAADAHVASSRPRFKNHTLPDEQSLVE